MKFRGLLAAVVLLAALGGAAWWSDKKQKAEAGKPAADAPPKILTIPEDQFKQIQLIKKASDTTTLNKADGKWQIVQPKPLAADQDSVSSLVSSLASLACPASSTPGISFKRSARRSTITAESSAIKTLIFFLLGDRPHIHIE